MGDSLIGSDIGSVNDIHVHLHNEPGELKEEPTGKIDDRFLKRCTEMVITNDDNLYRYFLVLDQKLFDGGKIEAAKYNANNNIHMTAFNLAREWNGACQESDDVKLDKMCDSLKAINRQADEPKFRKYFTNER